MGRRRTAHEREVSQKSDSRIERETAEKWANRAIACYALYLPYSNVDWLTRYDSYRHEALEHAAVVGDRGATVRRIQDKIDREIKILGARKTVVSKRRRRG